jgi:oligopeptide/dipeptide ABC transporter ATP-binding protein
VILQVDALSITFPDGGSGGRVSAVEGLSFDVDERETFAIIGESGSGKSVTAMSLVGLAPSTAVASGSVKFRGRELLNLEDREIRKIRGKDIGVVYQDPLSSMNPLWPVGEQIAEVIRAHGLAGRRAAAQRAVELLDSVHIPDPRRVARAYPHEISGGMGQRAMIAMALSCQPSLLIADEPTTALDVTIKAQILELLAELRDEMGLTVIIISHDMSVVAELADRIMVMYAGRIAETGSADQLMQRPRHPYTSALMETATLSEAKWKQPLVSIGGSAPVLAARPSGCAFHPRCPSRGERCAEAIPALATQPGGERVACHYPLASVTEA